MQLFSSEEAVYEWSTGRPKGAVFSPMQLWELAKRWYDDRLQFDWYRRTVEERQTLLNEVGLTGESWNLSVPQ